MNHQPNPRGSPSPIRCRLAAILWHVPRYQFRGSARLAKDAGVAKSAVRRLMRGEGQPTYSVLYRVGEAISREIGRPLDLREIAVEAGSEFPTRYPCEIFACRCMPPSVYAADGTLRPGFRHLVPGKWTSEDIQTPNDNA